MRGPISYHLEDFAVARMRLRAVQKRRGRRDLRARATIREHREEMERRATWLNKAGGAAAGSDDDRRLGFKAACLRVADDLRMGLCLCASCGKAA